MIYIGLRGPEDYEMLRRTLQIIDLVGQLRDELPADPVDLGDPGSEIDRLRRALPESPVDIRRTFFAALQTTRGCLAQISTILTENVPTTPTVLQNLLRAGLLSAGRLVYVLSPDAADLRLTRAKHVVGQDCSSLMKASAAFADFDEKSPHRPPRDVSQSWEKLNRAVAAWGRPPGEERFLRSMADTIEAGLLSRGFAAAKGETASHVIRTFHIYSGAAHGFGWPQLLPGTGSMTGIYVADLSLVASIAHLALVATTERSRP